MRWVLLIVLAVGAGALADTLRAADDLKNPPRQTARKPTKKKAPSLKADAPPAAVSYFSLAVEQKKQVVVNATEVVSRNRLALAEQRRRRVGRGKGASKSASSAAAKREGIAQRAKSLADAVASLKKLSDPTHLPVPRLSLPELKAGQVGEISGGIVQVADESNVLVRASTTEAIQDGPTSRVQFSTVVKLVWVSGLDTTGMTDDTPITVTVEITGTKQYATAEGASKTVLLAKPFDITPWLE